MYVQECIPSAVLYKKKLSYIEQLAQYLTNALSIPLEEINIVVAK